MTKPKPKPDDRELNPNYIYRKHSPIALGVIGYGISQIEEKVKIGELPPLVKLGSGRATGWYGSQLIELQRKRLAEAEAMRPIAPKQNIADPPAGISELAEQKAP